MSGSSLSCFEHHSVHSCRANRRLTTEDSLVVYHMHELRGYQSLAAAVKIRPSAFHGRLRRRQCTHLFNSLSSLWQIDRVKPI